MKTKSNKFDVIIYGATGYTGRICVEYLARSAPRGLKWAVAGRNHTKLKACLLVNKCEVPIVLASSDDRESLRAMCEATKCVISTVGPFSLYGTMLVEECVDSSTHYVDLTGETFWSREMIDRHHERAKANECAIVHQCGFDSVPSDLGVLYNARAAAKAFGEKLVSVACVVKLKGSVMSGGTVQSGLLISALPIATVKRFQSPNFLRKEFGPQLACRQPPEPRWTAFDADLNSWTAPWIMGLVNRQVTLRSVAIHESRSQPTESLFARNFVYTEKMGVRNWLMGCVISATMFVVMTFTFVFCRIAVVRRFLSKLLPGSGDGPPEAVRLAAKFNLTFVGTTETGRKMTTTVSGQHDPGYTMTARMICEAAIALATSDSTAFHQHGGGVLTPATAIGECLIPSLHEAGILFNTITQ